MDEAETKAREFYLHPSHNAEGKLFWRSVTGDEPRFITGGLFKQYEGPLHVIEYSAYEALEKRVQDENTRANTNCILVMEKDSEITALKAELEQMKATAEDHFKDAEMWRNNFKTSYQELRTQLSVAKEALEFYRDCTTHSFQDGKSYEEDRGDKASEALARIKRETKTGTSK